MILEIIWSWIAVTAPSPQINLWRNNPKTKIHAGLSRLFPIWLTPVVPQHHPKPPPVTARLPRVHLDAPSTMAREKWDEIFVLLEATNCTWYEISLCWSLLVFFLKNNSWTENKQFDFPGRFCSRFGRLSYVCIMPSTFWRVKKIFKNHESDALKWIRWIRRSKKSFQNGTLVNPNDLRHQENTDFGTSGFI